MAVLFARDTQVEIMDEVIENKDEAPAAVAVEEPETETETSEEADDSDAAGEAAVVPELSKAEQRVATLRQELVEIDAALAAEADKADALQATVDGSSKKSKKGKKEKAAVSLAEKRNAVVEKLSKAEMKVRFETDPEMRAAYKAEKAAAKISAVRETVAALEEKVAAGTATPEEVAKLAKSNAKLDKLVSEPARKAAEQAIQDAMLERFGPKAAKAPKDPNAPKLTRVEKLEADIASLRAKLERKEYMLELVRAQEAAANVAEEEAA